MVLLHICIYSLVSSLSHTLRSHFIVNVGHFSLQSTANLLSDIILPVSSMRTLLSVCLFICLNVYVYFALSTFFAHFSTENSAIRIRKLSVSAFIYTHTRRERETRSFKSSWQCTFAFIQKFNDAVRCWMYVSVLLCGHCAWALTNYAEK